MKLIIYYRIKMITKHYQKLHIKNINQLYMKKAIEHTNFKYDPSLSSHTVKYFTIQIQMRL